MPKLENFLNDKTPVLAIILGSGLQCNLPFVKTEIFSYSELPNFPQTLVKGHKGQMTVGELANGNFVLVFSGRFHLYEGRTPSEVQTIVNYLHGLGVLNLLITNAAGGIAQNLNIADLMIIDSIKDYQNEGNLQSDRGLLECTLKEPLEIKSKLLDFLLAKSSLKRGRYVAVLGPNYETAAEINLFRSQGCSAVGMSTYLEVKRALELNLNVAALSVITNSWNLPAEPTHEEVLANSKLAQQKLDKLFEEICELVQSL